MDQYTENSNSELITIIRDLDSEEDALHYVAGFVAKRVSQFTRCPDCQKLLIASTEELEVLKNKLLEIKDSFKVLTYP